MNIKFILPYGDGQFLVITGSHDHRVDDSTWIGSVEYATDENGNRIGKLQLLLKPCPLIKEK